MEHHVCNQYGCLKWKSNSILNISLNFYSAQTNVVQSVTIFKMKTTTGVQSTLISKIKTQQHVYNQY